MANRFAWLLLAVCCVPFIADVAYRGSGGPAAPGRVKLVQGTVTMESRPVDAGTETTIAPPWDAFPSVLVDSTGSQIVQVFDSKESLLAVLRSLPPDTLAMVGYEDANGNAQHLTVGDLVPSCMPTAVAARQ